MNKLILTAAATAVAGLIAGPAWAADLPSTKAAAAIKQVAVVTVDGNTDPMWQTILKKQIKTANQKDLNIDMSLECGLFTETNVKSKGGNKESATADVGVMIRVLVDGTAAKPDLITYCERAQTLSAKFQGIFQTGDAEAVWISSINGGFYEDEASCDLGDNDIDDDSCSEFLVVGTCLIQDPDTGGIFLDLDCLSPEEVGLILSTMNANAFNFLEPNVSSGVHTVEVQAKIVALTSISCEQEAEGLDCESDPLEQDAHAVLGWGSVFIEEVRLLKDDEGDSLSLD